MDDSQSTLGAVAGTGAVYYYIYPNQIPYVYWNGYYYCYAYPGYMIYNPTVDVNDGTDVFMGNQNGNGINSSDRQEADGVGFGHPRRGVPGKKRGNDNCKNFRGKQIWTPKKESESSFSDNTTVMIKNLPRKYRRDSFIEFLDKCCREHQMEYDFLYLPMRFKIGENKGYAFVNCTNESVAKKMKEFFQGHKWETYRTQSGTYTPNKISDSAWAKIQGKDELMRHFEKTIFNCGDYGYLPVLISPPRNGSNATTDASSLTIIGGVVMAGHRNGGVMENQLWYWFFYQETMPPAQPVIGYAPQRIKRANNHTKFRPKQLWIPKKEPEIPFSDNTTVMIKNIPKKYRRDSFMEFLDRCCLEHQLEYDFLYLPMKFNTGENKGYAFVNCTSAHIAGKMKEVFQGYEWGTYRTEYGTYTSYRVSESAWAKIQGKDAMVRNFAKTDFHCNNYKYLPVLISPPRNGFATTAPKLTIIGHLKGNYNNTLFT